MTFRIDHHRAAALALLMLAIPAPALAAREAYFVDFNFVQVVNTEASAVTGVVPLRAARAVAVHPSGRRVFAATCAPSLTPGAVVAIDTLSRTIVAEAPFGATCPAQLFVPPDGRSVFALVVDTSTIVFLDAATLAPTGVVNISQAIGGAVMHPSGDRLYLSTLSTPFRLFVVDTRTRAITSIPDIGANGPGVLDPAGHFLYVPGGSDGIAVVDTATDTVVATVPGVVQFGALSVDRTGSRLYASAANGVAVVDAVSRQVVTTVPLATTGIEIVTDVEVDPSGTAVYALGRGPCEPPRFGRAPNCSATLAVIDAATNTVRRTLVLPGHVGSTLAVHPDGGSLYVVNSVVADVIATATTAVVARLEGAGAVAFGPDVPALPGAHTFWAIGSATGAAATAWGATGDRPVPADYDGDGRADVAVWRPRESTEEGVWWIVSSSSGAVTRRQWGSEFPLDIPVPADYDGDHRADLAVFRVRQGVWFIARSSDGSTTGQAFGAPTDVPVPADYDGDGRADLAVFRAFEGTWYILQSSGAGVRQQQFGAPTDVPVPADYDGDGRADLAVWRPSTGTWFILLSSTGTVVSVGLGAPGDVPVPADYDGDRRADPAVWRPSTGEWFVLRSRDGSVTSVPWGAPGDIPLPRDWDGDGRADFAVYRP